MVMTASNSYCRCDSSNQQICFVCRKAGGGKGGIERGGGTRTWREGYKRKGLEGEVGSRAELEGVPKLSLYINAAYLCLPKLEVKLYVVVATVM